MLILRSAGWICFNYAYVNRFSVLYFGYSHISPIHSIMCMERAVIVEGGLKYLYILFIVVL